MKCLSLSSRLPCYVFCWPPPTQQIKIQMQISWVGWSTTVWGVFVFLLFEMMKTVVWNVETHLGGNCLWIETMLFTIPSLALGRLLCFVFCIFMNIRNTNIRIYKFTSIQIYKYTNIQIYKYTNTQIHKYTNIQIYKYTNIQIYKYTNIQIHKYIVHWTKFTVQWHRIRAKDMPCTMHTLTFWLYHLIVHGAHLSPG